MPAADLVPVTDADAERARLDHEAAVLGRMLDIFEQARKPAPRNGNGAATP